MSGIEYECSDSISSQVAHALHKAGRLSDAALLISTELSPQEQQLCLPRSLEGSVDWGLRFSFAASSGFPSHAPFSLSLCHIASFFGHPELSSAFITGGGSRCVKHSSPLHYAVPNGSDSYQGECAGPLACLAQAESLKRCFSMSRFKVAEDKAILNILLKKQSQHLKGGKKDSSTIF